MMKSKYYPFTLLIIMVFLISNIGCGQSYTRTYKYDKQKKQGWLGVEVQDVTNRLKEKKDLAVTYGAYVKRIVEDSPAEKAGFQKGDVIVKFGDKGIDDSDDLIDAVRSTKPKTEIKVEIYRNTDKKMLAVTIGKTKSSKFLSMWLDDSNIHVLPKIPKIPKMKLHIVSLSENYGLQVQSLTKQLGEFFNVPNGKGVLVSEVEKGSKAEKAGFKAGDVVVKIGSSSLDDIEEFQEELSDNVGKETTFEIIRNSKAMKLTMKIDDEDDDHSENMFIIPDDDHIKSFRFNLHSPEDLDLECLQDEFIDLRDILRETIRDVKKELEHEWLDS